MFEEAERGRKLSKEEYRAIEPVLRADLLDAQFALSKARRFPVIILISGVRGAGKGETIRLLNEWMDPRHIHAHAFDNPSDEERERPALWRYWMALPPKGEIGILFGSWYTQPIIDRVFKRTREPELLRSIDDIVRFERMLVDEGALLLKFWFHISKKRQKRRLKVLASHPDTAWRVQERDWDFFEKFNRFVKVSERMLRGTSRGQARWIVVDGSDPEHRAVTVGRTILDGIRGRLSPAKPAPPRRQAPPPAPRGKRISLARLDLSKTVSEKRYERLLPALQRRLALLTREPAFAGRTVVAVFEGMDAAGKGGAIRRVAAALDPRLYRIIPIAAPTDDERARPYLWRFWRCLPRLGRFTIYDRSWYGRVLVERVEGYCAPGDWRRAYGEINDFEEQIVRSGGILVKFWLQISKEEQLRRFRAREETRFKQFKITPEDWRNRKKWDAYQSAAEEMILRTSTHRAPWTIVEAEDKHHTRLKVIRTMVGAVERGLR